MERMFGLFGGWVAIEFADVLGCSDENATCTGLGGFLVGAAAGGLAEGILKDAEKAEKELQDQEHASTRTADNAGSYGITK